MSLLAHILRLRKLAKTCQFEQYNSEQAIRDQVVWNCKDKSLQTRFLKEENLTLNSLSQFAAAHKQAKMHASELDKENSSFQCSSINTIQATHGDVNVRLSQMEAEIYRLTKRTGYVPVKHGGNCTNCGRKQHENVSQCPACGKSCHFCKRQNHFKTLCLQFAEWKKRQGKSGEMQEQSRGDIQFIEDNQQNFVEDFDDFVFRVSNTVRSGDITVNVENVKVPFIIDLGASINVIDSNTFKEIKCNNPSLRLQPAKTRVSAYANKVTPMKGIFFSSIARGSKRTVAKVFVTEES